MIVSNQPKKISRGCSWSGHPETPIVGCFRKTLFAVRNFHPQSLADARVVSPFLAFVAPRSRPFSVTLRVPQLNQLHSFHLESGRMKYQAIWRRGTIATTDEIGLFACLVLPSTATHCNNPSQNGSHHHQPQHNGGANMHGCGLNYRGVMCSCWRWRAPQRPSCSWHDRSPKVWPKSPMLRFHNKNSSIWHQLQNQIYKHIK